MTLHNTSVKARNAISALGLLLCLLYALSIAMPDRMWGFHFIAFLPTATKVLLLLAAMGAVGLFHLKAFALGGKLKMNKWLSVLLLTAIAGIAFHKLPMYESRYGDAETFRDRMGERTEQYQPEFVQGLFSLNVSNPKSGNVTVLSAVRLLSFSGNITHTEAYRIIDTLFGMLFVFVWLLFIHAYIENAQLKLLASLLGLFTPFLQFFFGYEEIYAPAYFFTMLYSVLVLSWYRWRKQWMLWILIPTLFLALKFHSASWLMVPSIGLVFLHHFAGKNALIGQLYSWKGFAVAVLLPVLAGGAYVYFAVLGDHVDERFVGPDVDIYTRLFLPLFAPEAPLDRYTLLHANHLWDYVNLWFLWSGAGLFTIAAAAIGFGKRVSWNRPEVLIMGLTALFYAMLFFMVNPLMSMPLDSDYFSLAGPIVIVLAVALMGQLQETDFAQRIAGGTIGLSLLCLPIYLVNADQQGLGHRMVSTGKGVFKTYWIRASGDIQAGLNLLAGVPGQEQRIETILKELRPYANTGNDVEFATLLLEAGKFYRNTKKDYKGALSLHLEAQTYAPDLIANYIGLMESCYFLDRFEEAFAYSKVLVQQGYPEPRQAYRIAIECGVLAGKTDETLQFIEQFLQQWQDEDIIQLQQRLLSEKK